jgi:hypothetical protein
MANVKPVLRMNADRRCGRILCLLLTFAVSGCATGLSNADCAEARFQIEKEIYSYTYALDGGDLDALGELFEHAVMRVEGTDAAYAGSEAVKQSNIDFNLFYDAKGNPGLYRPDTTPRTRHVTTNIIVDIAKDGLSASARSSVIVFQFAPGAPLRPIIAAGYRDRFEPIDGRWRFTERVHLLTHIEDVSLHLQQPPPGQSIQQ